MHALSTTRPMLKSTRSAISRKPVNQKKKKLFIRGTYFYTFLPIFDSKFKIQMAENRCLTFWTSVKSTLNGPANGSEVTYSKIQNKLSRTP